MSHVFIDTFFIMFLQVSSLGFLDNIACLLANGGEIMPIIMTEILLYFRVLLKGDEAVK